MSLVEVERHCGEKGTSICVTALNPMNFALSGGLLGTMYLGIPRVFCTHIHVHMFIYKYMNVYNFASPGSGFTLSPSMYSVMTGKHAC
jgi:hypothetical protein